MAEKTDAQLIQLYNEVDAFLRQQYKHDRYADHSFLIQELAGSNRVVARHQQEMRAVAQLRNSLVHNPFGASAQPIAQPHPVVVKRYTDIHDALLNPHSALSIAILAQQIYTTRLDSKLSDVLVAMDKNIYTHVPVIKDDKMIGIFSENTLLSYLAESGEVIITDDMTIADFAEYIPLKSHRSESFAFLPRTASLNQVFEVFNKAIHKHIRIGLLIITEHGDENERPLGIITAWDLASPEFELG